MSCGLVENRGGGEVGRKRVSGADATHIETQAVCVCVCMCACMCAYVCACVHTYMASLRLRMGSTDAH